MALIEWQNFQEAMLLLYGDALGWGLAFTLGVSILLAMAVVGMSIAKRNNRVQ